MGTDPNLPSARTQTLLRRLFDELDYPVLGEVYCDEGAEAFWDAHREPALELGVQWARASSIRIPRGGASLYVGAGVAELAVLTTEVCDLDRRVVVANLDSVECETLNATLTRVGLGERIRFQCIDAADLIASDPGLTYDHLSVVSVLNDPMTYPVVSGVAYGRIPPVLLEVAAFTQERERIASLVASVLGKLAVPGIITTTVEEVSWFLAFADKHGIEIEADDEVVSTAIVGDPLGFLRVTRIGGAT